MILYDFKGNAFSIITIVDMIENDVLLLTSNVSESYIV
jgi:hypothetical protein